MLLKKFISLVVVAFLLSLFIGEGVRAEVGQPSADPIYLSFEQRVILTYLMAGASLAPEEQQKITERFLQTYNRYAVSESREIYVADFEQFLKVFRGDWPVSYSINSSLDLLEKGHWRGPVTFKAINGSLQKRIDEYILVQAKFFKQQFEDRSLGEWLHNPLKLLNASIAQDGSPENGQFIEISDYRISKEIIEPAYRMTELWIQHETQRIELLSQSIAAQAIKGGDQSPIQIFLREVLIDYFRNLSLNTKKQVISQLIGNDINADYLKQFEILILSSGPQFQKLLQILSRESNIGDDVKALFKRLESKSLPIPASLAKELIDSESDNYRWMKVNEQPLGVGTMAQVNQGEIFGLKKDKKSRRQVVIRFLKPEIQGRVEEDHQILMAMAPKLDANPRLRDLGLPKITPVIEDLTKTVMEELQLQKTVEQQKKAYKIYQREFVIEAEGFKFELEMKVPKIIEPLNRESKLHVQERVSGKKMDVLMKQYFEFLPSVKKAILEKVAHVWLEEVIYGSGFFHSDLHQGNFLVDFVADQFTVWILDFGMVGQLSIKQQNQFLILGSGLELQDSRLIALALWNLSDQTKNQITKSELEKIIDQHNQELQKQNLSYSVDRWTAIASDAGLRFPTEFIGLNRGLVIIDQMLRDAGSSYSISSLTKELAKQYPLQSIQRLRQEKALSAKDFFNLGYSALFTESKKIAPMNLLPNGNGTARADSIVVRCQMVYQ